MSSRQPINCFFLYIKYMSCDSMLFLFYSGVHFNMFCVRAWSWFKMSTKQTTRINEYHMKLHALFVERERMIHICCFIMINRYICNWWMTNNKTFTSTFLTCPHEHGRSGCFYLFFFFLLVRLLVYLFSMDYSNQFEQMIATAFISIVHTFSSIQFAFCLFSFVVVLSLCFVLTNSINMKNMLNLSKKAIAWQMTSKYTHIRSFRL